MSDERLVTIKVIYDDYPVGLLRADWSDLHSVVQFRLPKGGEWKDAFTVSDVRSERPDRTDPDDMFHNAAEKVVADWSGDYPSNMHEVLWHPHLVGYEVVDSDWMLPRPWVGASEVDLAGFVIAPGWEEDPSHEVTDEERERLLQEE
jgi:hypothetical protein